MTGVICDGSVSAKVRVYLSVVRLVVCFRDSGINKKTRGRAGGGRVEDAAIFLGVWRMETDDPLWRPIMGATERKIRRD